MNKVLKTIAIIGAVLLLCGSVLFVVGMSAIGWDFSLLSSLTAERKTYSVASAGIDEIELIVSTGDVQIIQSTEGEIVLEYADVTNKGGELVSTITPTLEGGKLHLIETQKFTFSFFSFGVDKHVTLKIPQDKAVAISAQTGTGSVTLGESGKKATFTSLNVQTGTGSVDFKGEITVNNTVYLQTGTGSIYVNAPLYCQTLQMQTGTGSIECRNTLLATSIDAQTGVGSIKLICKGEQSEYSYSYETGTGSSNLSAFTSGARTIKLKTGTGSIQLSFQQE